MNREEGLSLRLKRRRKRVSHLRVVQPGPTGPNQHWAMDFVSDCLENGRRLRMLTVVDLFDRRSPVIETDHSLTGERVARALERLNALGQCPAIIRTDNGPEFTSKALDQWAHGRGVKLVRVSNWSSSGLASRWKTAISKASTAGCGKSA